MKTYNVFLVIYKLNIYLWTLLITYVIEVIALTSTIIYFKIDVEILYFFFPLKHMRPFLKIFYITLIRQLDVMIKILFRMYEYEDKHTFIDT